MESPQEYSGTATRRHELHLNTRHPFHTSQSYLLSAHVIDYLIKLGVALSEKVETRGKDVGFLVLNTEPPINRQDLLSYAEKTISQDQIIVRYLDTAKKLGRAKNIKIKTQVGNRIFDAVGEAVSRRYMVVVFDFNLIRTTNDYDIEGLLDRIFSVYRKKFKQIVITYCVSRRFTKEAQQKAMTGRFNQINLIQVEMENGQLVTKRISGISKHSRGEFFENQIRYILRKVGFQDVQRGLKVYRDRGKLTQKPTPEEFTDIDIVAKSDVRKKVIVCELKNWHIEVPQTRIEDWVQNKLNKVVDYLRIELGVQEDVEAWFIVSRKCDIDETKIQEKCSCKIKVLSKLDLIEIISEEDRYLANELKPIVLD